MQAYLKPRTDLCVFTFGGRKFQTDDPENAKLILYKCVCVCVCVCDEINISLCLCKRSGLLRDGTVYMLLLLLLLLLLLRHFLVYSLLCFLLLLLSIYLPAPEEDSLSKALVYYCSLVFFNRIPEYISINLFYKFHYRHMRFTACCTALKLVLIIFSWGTGFKSF